MSFLLDLVANIYSFPKPQSGKSCFVGAFSVPSLRNGLFILCIPTVPTMTSTMLCAHLLTCESIRAGPISQSLQFQDLAACLRDGVSRECFWKQYFLAIPGHTLQCAQVPLITADFFPQFYSEGICQWSSVLDHRCPCPLGGHFCLPLAQGSSWDFQPPGQV